jgi:hypothetical protein
MQIHINTPSIPVQAKDKRQRAITPFNSAPAIRSKIFTGRGALFPLFLFLMLTVRGQVASIGKPLPPWQQGWLDLHHINTGRGNAAFYILPDGTTILFDAGELNPTDPRTTSKRNTPIRPDDSKRPYEWIAYYIQHVASRKEIDYAVISHFHDDHFGGWYAGAPVSRDGKFTLSGISGVADLLPVHRLLTRDYHYPVDPAKLPGQPDNPRKKSWNEYLAFLGDRRSHGYADSFLRAGSRTQIRLLHQAARYPDCYVRNIKSNGWIWTGGIVR